MHYNELLATLQKLIPNKNIDHIFIGEILGEDTKKMWARKNQNYNFKDAELKNIENELGITLTSDDCIEIDHIHLNPSCGRGTVVIEEPEVTPIKLGTQMIQSVLKISDPHNLKTFKACGDSMETIIEDGDILLVDTGRTDFNNGGVFLLTINNDWFVKRLRKRLSGELDVISDNLKYPVETFKPDADIEIIVKGRVVKNLSRGL